ncbi:hypothetical protein ACLKA7_007753 [Drosophila subpalustris]
MEMNYGGSNSKKGLSSFENLNNALFEATKREGYSLDDYKRDVRAAFGKAKNRVYKAVSKENRIKRQAAETEQQKHLQ